MAINAAARARVRTDGSDENGAFYDATISGAGTDYTDQASHQAAWTNLSCLVADDAGRLAIRDASAGGLFTSAMIGNAIRIRAGTSWTYGYYFIVSVTSSDVVVLDRSPAGGADRTGGSGKVGGAALTLKKVADSANATNEKCVAGNTIYIRGSGTDTPSSDDYTFTTHFTPVAGTTTAGRTQIIGYNGRPRIKCNGLIFYNAILMSYEGLYLTCSSNSNGSLGLVHGVGIEIINCVLDAANQTAMVCATLSGAVVNCELKGGRSAASSGGYGISTLDYITRVVGCKIREVGEHAIRLGSASHAVEVVNTIIYKPYGDAVRTSTGSYQFGSLVANCTIDQVQGYGIYLVDASAVAGFTIINNIFSNISQASKEAIYCAAGSLALNDRLRGFIDYNFFYNNTADHALLSAGANSGTGTDPGYVDPSNGDHRIGTALKALGFPGQFLNATGSIGYMDPGAVQREEPSGSGGGGPLVGPGRLIR